MIGLRDFAIKFKRVARSSGVVLPSAPIAVPECVAQRTASLPQFREPARPIFIIGAPRSGTSITNWALGQHPNIQPVPETGWIATMAVGVQSAYFAGSARGHYSHLSNVRFPPEPFFRRMGEAIDRVVCDVFDERCTRLHGDWRSLEEIKNPEGHPSPEMRLRRHSKDPKTRWVDATPLNSMYVWGLATLFPCAQFIHLIRDPHEVVASLANFENAGGKSHELTEAIQNWLDHTHAAYLAQKALGSNRVGMARFEMLSDDPKRFLQGILNFLGEEWCEDCLAPLGQKINSSETGSEREAVRARLANDATYQRALALYKEITTRKFVPRSDQAALDEIKLTFQRQAVAFKPV